VRGAARKGGPYRDTYFEELLDIAGAGG
jgi:hypothetical protein